MNNAIEPQAESMEMSDEDVLYEIIALSSPNTFIEQRVKARRAIANMASAILQARKERDDARAVLARTQTYVGIDHQQV